MLKGALFLALADARNLLRAKETVVWIFVMPALFFYFIGTVTGGSGGGDRDPRAALAVSIPDDAGFLADHLLARLEQGEFRIDRPDTPEAWDQAFRRLTLPPAMTAKILAGEPVKLAFSRGSGGDPSSQLDELRLQRAVYATLADLIVVERDGEASAQALEDLRGRAHNLEIAVTAAGRRPDPPNGFEQAVPGITVMFTLLVLFTGGAITLLLERRDGLLRRLASSPMSRSAVVAGKWGARLIMGLVQIGVAMLIGRLLFGIDWQPLGPVLLVLFAYAALASALAILLGNFARTDGQAIGIGVVATNLLGALGGCWWPIEVTPEWAQRLSLMLPTGWAMDALHRLMSFGQPPAAVLPHLAAFALATLLAGWIVSRRFRFQ